MFALTIDDVNVTRELVRWTAWLPKTAIWKKINMTDTISCADEAYIGVYGINEV